MSCRQEQLHNAKGEIRPFLAAHYSDFALARLLVSARDGTLRFNSCCCFIGQAALAHTESVFDSDTRRIHGVAHYNHAKAFLRGAIGAEQAYLKLGYEKHWFDCSAKHRDSLRRRRLIPILKAEIRRRMRLAHPVAPEREAVHA